MLNPDTQLRRQVMVAAGLTDKEAALYDVLLSLGRATGAELEKRSGLKKNTYSLLKALGEKHLVLQVLKEGKIYYQPAPPERLTELVEQQEMAVQKTKETLAEFLPTLKSTYTMNVGKPTVRYYEGAEGLRKVFADIYAPKDEPVYGAVDAEKIDSFIKNMSYGELVPSRIKNKLEVKCIYNDNELGQRLKAREKEELREAILFDPDKYPLPAEIETYQNKVAMMSFKKTEFVGLIVENEDFAVTIRSILKYLFDHMRECKQVGRGV